VNVTVALLGNPVRGAQNSIYAGAPNSRHSRFHPPLDAFGQVLLSFGRLDVFSVAQIFNHQPTFERPVLGAYFV